MSNFRSDHPSGSLFHLCDGSVQFTNENISLNIYTGLLTINGGESVQGGVGDPKTVGPRRSRSSVLQTVNELSTACFHSRRIAN
jgi:hypothetical protein